MTDLQSMVHDEVTAKLTSTDTLLKENISKLVKSKVRLNSYCTRIV